MTDNLTQTLQIALRFAADAERISGTALMMLTPYAGQPLARAIIIRAVIRNLGRAADEIEKASK